MQRAVHYYFDSLLTVEGIAAVARTVAAASDLRLVVVFDSFARGDRCPRDIDIGVVGTGSSVNLLDLTNQFIAALGTDAVDVVDLRRANPVLLMAVARDGRALFDRTGTDLAEFSSLAMLRFLE